MKTVCNKNFQTQYAYINDTYVHITDYISNHRDKTALCEKNHELVLCNGQKNKIHFRHKYKSDVYSQETSEWHLKWQSYFVNTEIPFKKVDDKQIKDRRADVVLKNNCILEIQHSNISDSEVICRASDYKINGKDVIWIIDGNTKDVKLDVLSDSSYLIEFCDDWKYKSFQYKYDFVLVDIDDKIFKIKTKSVHNKLSHTKMFHTKEKIVDVLRTNPTDIWNIWDDDNDIKPTLRIKQEGAGNGKTFGIWKSISLNLDKQLYIIITKQHTAKDVIMKELNDQAERNEYHIVSNIENIDIASYGKQYIINYEHMRTKRKCVVVIGSIDSFVFSLTSKYTKKGSNFFEGLLYNICENGCDKMNTKTGEIKYAGMKLNLDKTTELWIDETQDLSILYYKAFVKLMLLTKIDIVIVGDKLQSLEYHENFMTFIDEDGQYDINVVRDSPKNINRRIKVLHMAKEINKLVDFDEYNLPKIEVSNKDELHDHGKSVVPFTQKCVYHNDTDEEKVNEEVNKILEYVDDEVNKYDYKPKDFLFIFPIMKGNQLAGELETKLNEYWSNKLDDKDEYHQYAVLHRHEAGQVIDTTLSQEATRIMSIRASKGDGRAVVFVLNCTEQSLKLFSNGEKNIVYESYLHVALTRAKNKLYFGYQKNNDDIHRRLSIVDNDVIYTPTIKNSIHIETLAQYKDVHLFNKLLDEHGIEQYLSKMLEKDLPKKSTSSKMIDWDYHCIRHAVYYNFALFEIFSRYRTKELLKQSQIKVVMDKISKLSIVERTPKQFYEDINKLKPLEDLIYFPLCKVSKQNRFYVYFQKIKSIMLDIQNKYKKNNLSIGDFSPMYSSILIIMIDLYTNKQYHHFTPLTMYNIIHAFETNNNVQEFIEETKIIKMIVHNLLNDKIPLSIDIEWNIEHNVTYDGNNEDFKIYNHFDIIGHSKEYVYHLMFKTDIGDINIKEVLFDILVERMLLFSPKSNEHTKNNNTRFNSKRIITYLLILKQNRYEVYDLNIEETIFNEMRTILSNSICKYMSLHNKHIFNYFCYVKNNMKIDEKFKKYSTPYECIAKDEVFRKNEHIKNFFNYLHQEYNFNNKYHVRNITNNFEMFDTKLNECIKNMSKTYFNIHDQDEKDDW